MTDMSILIPARNEIFLAKTVEDILENMRGDTEVIAIADGYWPEPGIKQHSKVTLVHHNNSIGQRAATNEAARISTAKFIMKCDAHCGFDEGFDVKLMEDCEYDWTVVPRMYNLHAFDWKCNSCGNQTYQGPKPEKCEKCGGNDFEMFMIWKPRLNRRSDFARFDKSLHFQYWRAYEKRPESKGDIADLMCSVGACWMMHRQRFFDLGCLDEEHGSWGQMGVEVACKSWLSGGRQVVNKKTWYAHMFRTQPGFGFPYPNPGITQARKYSRRLWMENKWDKAVRPLSWLVDKFAPVPEWDNKKLALYYTCNTHDERIEMGVRKQLNKVHDETSIEIGCVSLKPTEFGNWQIVLPLKRSPESMHRQILAGLEHADGADIIFLCESDVLYHPSHFDFVPPRDDVFCYNTNIWRMRYSDGHCVWTDNLRQVSGLCAFRDVLLEHYRMRIERIEKEGKYDLRIGYEPGAHRYPRGIHKYVKGGKYGTIFYQAKFPNIDIRHDKTLTLSKWSPDEFRNKKYAEGWKETDGDIPGWGSVNDILRLVR